MELAVARRYMLTLPHVQETMQWGENLVFWVGDKALGGKMFALAPLDGMGGLVISFAAGPERAAELLEQQGFRPAPYLARAHWVAAERWSALRAREWEEVLLSAHGYVFGRLPPKTRGLLALPADEQQHQMTRARAMGPEPTGSRSGQSRKKLVLGPEGRKASPRVRRMSPFLRGD